MTIKNGERIKFALPSKGRISEPSINLLHRAGYTFRTQGRNLYATCTNDNIIFIFVRADDIPVLVASGAIDIGITGSDLIIEHEADVAEILPLGFGKCRLCVAVKNNFSGTGLSSFAGKNIATSFPKMASDFFAKSNVPVNCIRMKGSVEIMIDLNLADGIVDLVETGDSLRDNDMRVFAEIGSYEAELIASKKIASSPEIQQIKRRIEGILIADMYALIEYNIPESRLKEAERITPGYSSPTVSRLDKEGWLAVKVMVKKSEIAAAMDLLESIGAAAILETPVKNCRL
ncbi:MAG: ATP phosphoribosyltransferase [Leptospirales bacterium]|nr:ATP phosphoribosyltransferase [Leptospirales bacterium]